MLKSPPTKTELIERVLITLKYTRQFVVIAVLAFSAFAVAQQESASVGCHSSELTAAPTRPTITSSTTTTQCGVVEADYGLTSVLPGDGTHQEIAGGSLRYGITPNIDFRWGGDSLHSYYGNGTHVMGTGDNWLGGRIRLTSEKQTWASTAFSYTIKLPSASAVEGFGSGFTDHSFTFIASKDIQKWHFDFNAVQLLGGRPGSGWDTNTTLALATSHPLKGKWGAFYEAWGQTRLNASSPAFASNIMGVTYTLSPRAVLDCGTNLGLTPEAQRAWLMIGATYSLANLNTLFKR